MKTTTAQFIYEGALALLGEPAGSEAYAERAIPCINLLLAELSALSGVLSGEAADLSAAVPRINTLGEILPLEDTIVRPLAPIGLAWLLLNEEETDRASLFYRIYRKAIEEMRASRRGGRKHPIRNVY